MSKTTTRKFVVWAFIAVLMVAAKVAFFSTMNASVLLSDTKFCQISTNGLYHWGTDRRIPLVYYSNGNEAGRVEFRFSPECYPEAIFPTEDKQNVVCLYGTDMTIALFVIELDKSSEPNHSAPQGFFASVPSIVTYTDFALRRCTSDEANYLKRYIQSLDDATLRRLCVTGLPFPYDAASTRRDLLSKIEHLTTPGHVPLAGEIPEVSSP